jgi:putative ABC transport system permease protein
MRTLFQDLQYALRLFQKTPGFTVIAVLTLALGIGANTAIFSVADAVLFRPLPFKNQEQLVMVWERNPQFSADDVPVTPPNYLFLRAQARTFEGLAATAGRGFNLTEAGEPERLAGRAATTNFFALLGVAPALGRGFTAEDEQPGKEQVALLSHRLWQRRFGAEAGIIGRQIKLNDRVFTVVGVLPQTFHLATLPADVWVPLPFTARDAQNRGAHMLTVLGRIKPGVASEQGQAELDALMQTLAAEQPRSNSGWSVLLRPLREQGVKGARQALLVLLGAVGFVLLIACANVASLLLARAAGRGREFAVRVALGASGLRLARQLFTESLLLAASGGALGLLLGEWCVGLFVAIGPQDIPRLQQAGLDWRVVAFTLALTGLTALLAGLAPIFKALRVDLNEVLKEGDRGAARGFGHLRLITIAEIALSLVLLTGAGLLIKSYALLLKVNPGVRTENVLALTITLPVAKYSTLSQTSNFFQALVERVGALPGVVSAAVAQNLPLSGSNLFFYIEVEGQPPRPLGQELEAECHVISADYFRTLGIPLRDGRVFSTRDVAEAAPVVVISESLARRYFLNSNPLGRKIRILANNQPPREIVGVVADVKHRGPELATRDEFYVPQQQFQMFSGALIVHTAGDPLNTVAAIKQQVWALDPAQPISRVTTMAALLAETLAQKRFSTLLLGVFAALALLLAAIGVYGVMSYGVSQATREIAIRVALGAQGADILKLIVGQGLVLTLIALALGLVGAFALTRYLATQLFAVSTVDPLVFAAAPLLLAVIALLACYIPARRATKVDPLVALRYE